MPNISFTFEGWVQNAPIEQALDTKKVEYIDVSKMSSKELIEKLNSGKLAINFTKAYLDANECDLEIKNYQKRE